MKSFSRFLAASLSFALGGTESSKSYMITSDFDESDFSSMRSEDAGTNGWISQGDIDFKPIHAMVYEP